MYSKMVTMFILAFLVLALVVACVPSRTVKPDRGVALEKLTWQQAEKLLTPDTVVVIPLGAQSKEHGLHLPLNNDFIMAEYFAHRILASEDVVVMPTVNYGFYPAFTEYPGSVSTSPATQRDLIVEICRSISRYGPKRFYVLNTGVSTLGPLRASKAVLAAEGIALDFTFWPQHIGSLVQKITAEEGGSHADEVETSMMLYIAPEVVDMSKARKDYNPDRPGPMTRDPNGQGTYSPTGAWGDPTLATREKGRQIVEALVEGMRKDIADLKAAPLPKKP